MKTMRMSTVVMALVLGVSMTFTSCETKKSYKVVHIVGNSVAMDASQEVNPDSATIKILEPYKDKIHQTMTTEIGVAAKNLTSGQPESTLGNLVARMLREAAVAHLGKPADMALVNVGGLRADMAKGKIMNGTIFEILPFDNSLSIVYLHGDKLKDLMQNIATAGGEGVSNCTIRFNANHDLISAKVGGKSIDPNKVYTVSTIDYLVEGNDGMTALTKADSVAAFPYDTLRDLMMQYIVKQTKAGKLIDARIDGRIKMVK
ncbi:MAG TPA: 5'-nucleotidase [Bacteroidaceae bacterium]|nr:5'-nucleotidase [Bacteroidaceae bacterium]